MRRVASLGICIGLLGVVLSAIPAVLRVEEALGLGWLFALRGPIEPPSEVVIVGISAESARTLGLGSDVGKWPRTRHAELIERLAAGDPAAIAVDIMFDEDRPDDPGGDLALAGAIERAGNVILAERLQEAHTHPGVVGEQRLRPIDPLRRAAFATAPFILPRVPARVSQSWAFGRPLDVASLPAAALHAYAMPAHERLVEMLGRLRPGLAPLLHAIDRGAIAVHGLEEVMRRLREVFRADPQLADDLYGAIGQGLDREPLLAALIGLYAGADSRYLNFYGPARTIPTIPFDDVLDADAEKLRELVGGRVVFVGFSEAGRASQQQDEFESVFSQRTGQLLAGVEIGATMFANLLRRESIRPLPLPLHLAIVAVWGMAAAAIAVLLRGFVAVAAGVVAAAAFAGAMHYAFQAHDLWGPLAVPLGVQLPAALLVGLSLSHALLREQRERIRSALGYYVPLEVLDDLAKASLRPRASRELVFGTCLVTDAEQYTTLSEALHPTELGELMDAYYEVLVEAVHRQGGIVSDIGGDSMIAVWPAAGSVASTRASATRAALEILAAVETFNRARVRGELPTRIGIDSGQLLLGNVGASMRGEYRAVGDIVNTASRLQGLNRLLGTRILMSAAAAADVDGFVYRPLGEFLLVGKRTPVAVLEVRAPKGAADAAVLELDAMFGEALARFKSGELAAARAAFAGILDRFPNDRASRFFLEQCEAHGELEPDAGWDGVVRVTVK